jgi:hypothetical protein
MVVMILSNWRYRRIQEMEDQHEKTRIKEELALLEKQHQNLTERLQLLKQGRAEPRKMSRRTTPTPKVHLLREAILEIESTLLAIDIKIRQKRNRLSVLERISELP